MSESIKNGKFVMTTNISDITSLQENKSFDRFEIRMYNKIQWYSYTYNFKKVISGTNFLISCVTPKFTITQCLMVWFLSSGDRVAITERKCTKHVAAIKLYKNKLVILSGVELVFMSACLQGYHHIILNIN